MRRDRRTTICRRLEGLGRCTTHGEIKAGNVGVCREETKVFGTHTEALTIIENRRSKVLFPATTNFSGKRRIIYRRRCALLFIYDDLGQHIVG